MTVASYCKLLDAQLAARHQNQSNINNMYRSRLCVFWRKKKFWQLISFQFTCGLAAVSSNDWQVIDIDRYRSTTNSCTDFVYFPRIIDRHSATHNNKSCIIFWNNHIITLIIIQILVTFSGKNIGNYDDYYYSKNIHHNYVCIPGFDAFAGLRWMYGWDDFCSFFYCWA